MIAIGGVSRGEHNPKGTDEGLPVPGGRGRQALGGPVVNVGGARLLWGERRALAALFARGRMSASTTLKVRLLGRMEVQAGAATIRIGGRHAQALMALLVLRPRPRLRDTLAAELWPEAGAPSSGSLRQALWLIRSTLTSVGLDAERWLEADQDTIGLHRDIALHVDVDTFESLAASDDAVGRERDRKSVV